MVAIGVVVGVDDMDMVESSNITVDSVIKLITSVGETIPVVVTLTLLSAVQCW